MSDYVPDSRNKLPLLIDDHYFKLEIVTETGFKATCLLCPDDSPATVSGNLGVNSNLLRHLKIKHSDIHESYREEQAKKRKLEKQPPRLHQKHYSRKEVTKSIANFVIESAQSISIVEHPSFKNLVSVLSGIFFRATIFFPVRNISEKCGMLCASLHTHIH